MCLREFFHFLFFVLCMRSKSIDAFVLIKSAIVLIPFNLMAFLKAQKNFMGQFLDRIRDEVSHLILQHETMNTHTHRFQVQSELIQSPHSIYGGSMEEARAKQVRYREINRPWNCKFRSVIQIRRGSCRQKAAVEFIPYFVRIYSNEISKHIDLSRRISFA